MTKRVTDNLKKAKYCLKINILKVFLINPQQKYYKTNKVFTSHIMACHIAEISIIGNIYFAYAEADLEVSAGSAGDARPLSLQSLVFFEVTLKNYKVC